MKKSVALVIVMLFILPIAYASSKSYMREVGGSRSYSPITGAQILDLPPPPPPPGMEQQQPQAPAPTPTPPPTEPPTPTTKAAELLEQAQQEVTTLTGRIDTVERKLTALDLLPGFEDRLNKAEQQTTAASNIVARVDALQSQVESMKVDVDNLKQFASRPVVEEPTFFGSLQDIQSKIKRNAVLSLTLAVLALLVALGIILAGIMQKKSTYLENKHMIKQYLANYQKAGYKLETLRMHLRACGWKDEFVEEVLHEMG